MAALVLSGILPVRAKALPWPFTPVFSASFKNPNIVVQVDRCDLNKQLYEEFVAAKDLVGDVALAQTTDELRQLLGGEGGGVVFSTIDKFRLANG